MPSRPEGHARTTRVGGATRRALHGVEHRSMLSHVMADAITISYRMHVDGSRSAVNGDATGGKTRTKTVDVDGADSPGR